jgi:hypothetical protein
MREEIIDEYGRLAVVQSGGPVDLGTVWLSADDDSADWGAEPTLRLSAADARKLAAALLRAADEAEGA